MADKKKKTTKKDKTRAVKEMAEKLLSLMGVEVEVEVEEDKENEAVSVDIRADDEAGLLIGNRGKTLNSIQALLGMIYRQKSGEWQRILVNVDDWREKEEDRLSSLAFQAAERAKSTGEEQALYNLTPAQRRVVHLTLAEDEEVQTESKGEGKERYLLVSPK